MEIIPSILTNDPVELKNLIEECEGVVERVSIDIIDGRFVNNKTIDPSLLSDIETILKIDYQLMVTEPIHWVERCIRGSADRIIGHIEMMANQVEFVAKAQEVGTHIGLAVNLETPISNLDSMVLSDLDVVLVMSASVGFGGQSFNAHALEKIKELKKIRDAGNYHFRIHVDGGVNEESIYNVCEAGADEVSIGRRIFKGSLSTNIAQLTKLVNL